MAKKHMRKCSPSLAIKEKQFRTTLRFHLSPVRTGVRTSIEHQEHHQQQMLARMRGQMNPHVLAAGNVN
jgi:hypothetical protein